MPTANQPPSAGIPWIVAGVAGLFFGFLLGYVVGTGTHAPASQAAVVASQTTSAPAADAPAAPQATGVLDEGQLQSYKNILARDPNNVQAAESLGNMLYDAARYADAIPYYERAFALDAKNVNLSTDLGTCYWYSGRPDAAIAQYNRSLAIDPTHGQTLFNLGIVKLEGTHDPKGAIEAWEKLLATNKNYPDAAKVQELLAQARQQVASTAAPTPVKAVR